MSRDTVVSPLAPGSGRLVDWVWDIYTTQNGTAFTGNVVARAGALNVQFWNTGPGSAFRGRDAKNWLCWQLGGTAFGTAGGADNSTNTAYSTFGFPWPYGTRVSGFPEIDCISYISYRVLMRCLSVPTGNSDPFSSLPLGAQGVFFHTDTVGTAPSSGGPINQTGQNGTWGIVAQNDNTWRMRVKLSSALPFADGFITTGINVTDWHWHEFDVLYGSPTQASSFTWKIDGVTLKTSNFDGNNLPGDQGLGTGIRQWFMGVMGSGTTGNSPLLIAAARVIAGPNDPSVY